ncbi:hypothetical protein [Streptomyces cucumeris]|uniref:hypothetical protein n=1 Tax=Streptomyces cucumeris TaxID=2962890 RepID=UPI003D705233
MRTAAEQSFAAYDRLVTRIFTGLGVPDAERLTSSAVALIFGLQLRSVATGRPPKNSSTRSCCWHAEHRTPEPRPGPDSGHDRALTGTTTVSNTPSARCPQHRHLGPVNQIRAPSESR